MSTAAATPQEQAAPEMDAKQLATFIEARNKGEAIPKPAPVEEKKPEPASEEQPKAASSRSQRRALRAAEERTANLVLETLTKAGVIKKEVEPEPAKEDAEPKRADFASDAEYLRATQKWDKAQEAKTEAAKGTETAQTEELKKFLGEMDTKATEDMKSLKDWDTVMKTAQDHEDLPEFIPDEQPTLMEFLAKSDMRAFMLYHWAKPENFEAFQNLLDSAPVLPKPGDFKNKAEYDLAYGKAVEPFWNKLKRLEGRLEVVYDADRSEKTEAAQATPEKEKTAPTPQKPQGRAEPQQEAQPAKPKPSSEVAARGGSPAPEEPAIGSPAWMLKRNQAQYGH